MNASRIASVLGAALLVAVTGCADGAPEGPGTTSEAPGATTSVATNAPSETDSVTSTESQHNDADVTFAQMMTIHHEGALEMSELAVDNADSDDVRELAATIEAAQGPEIELMQSWLTAWEQPLGNPDHDGMDHAGMDMDGKSQDEVMAELQQLSGSDFDKTFLSAMIAHHEGAVVMSQEELQDGENADALELAQDIIDAQRSEIQQMQQLLQNL